PRLDVDSFERHILGAERRLVRIGSAGGRPVAVPDSGQLVLLSCRNIFPFLVSMATLWKRGFVPLLVDAELPREEIAQLVKAFRPAFCLLDRRASPAGRREGGLGGPLIGRHAFVPGRQAGPSSSRGPGRTGFPTHKGAAILRLTSGSTGRPRGIAVSADQLLADARHIATGTGLRPADTMVTAIP